MLGFACAAARSSTVRCAGGGSSCDGGDRRRAALTRRAALRVGFSVAAAAAATLPASVRASPLYGKPSASDLLQKLGKEETEEEIAAKKEARAEARRERLERQRELAAEAERRRAEGAPAREEVEIEANLRANYYQPTGRKRYLPKIKRANDNLPLVRESAVAERWSDVAAAVASDGFLDDLVLPMRLYASGLSGQGLSLAAKFVQDMSEEADVVEKALKNLKKAVKKKDDAAAVAYLDEIGQAIARYRKLGKLEAEDFGIGEVPKDARVGSGLGNNNPALYNRNFSKIGGARE